MDGNRLTGFTKFWVYAVHWVAGLLLLLELGLGHWIKALAVLLAFCVFMFNRLTETILKMREEADPNSVRRIRYDSDSPRKGR